MKFIISSSLTFFKNHLVKIFFIGSTIWLLIVFSDFFLPSILPGFQNNLFRMAAKSVCHASPDKLISDGSGSTLVCARCTGIYTGVFAAALTALILSSAIKIKSKYFRNAFWIVTSVMIFDVFADDFGLYRYSHFFSFIIGLLWGLIVQFIIFEKT